MSCAAVFARHGQILANAARRTATTVRHQPKPRHSQTWSFLPDAQERRLTRLMEEANLRSHDPEIQAAYLRALGKSRPDEVVRRVELERYATGDAVAKEYIKALVATGKLDRAQLANVLSKTTQSATPNVSTEAASTTSFWGISSTPKNTSNGSTNLASASAASASAGTQAEPIHVALAEPSTASQLWRAVRVLGTTFLVLGFLGVVMEERGMMRGMGINTDMSPQPESGDPTTFSDVKGCEEAKAELEEVVQFLRAPERFTRLGGKLPKGLLLMGPPGTGKTLLAKAIAGEAHRPFFYASGSEFEEMFVGVGAKRVRELFASAKRHAPCIIFIDEIDAIGGKRNPKDQRFLTMTLNQFLVELDGFQSSDGIVVIAATNFPESLDKALVRPGRFDRHVVVPAPDVRGRTEILELHAEKIPLEEDVELEIIARGTPGFSGADLANLVNMAALKAAIEDFGAVAMSHLEYAKDKILMGAERRSVLLSDETKQTTAYHEGGHALCCLYSEDALPLHKATIMPRGQALGMVAQLPKKDMTSMSKAQMLAKLVVCMGGRAAEELVFGSERVTSGAASDFQQATELAEAMVSQYGMTDELGMVVYNKEKESGETRAAIERQVRRLVDDAFSQAKNILRTHEKELHRLARALLEHETLTSDQVKLAVKGELGKVLDTRAAKSSAERSVPSDKKTEVEGNKGSVLDAPNATKCLDAVSTDPVSSAEPDSADQTISSLRGSR